MSTLLWILFLIVFSYCTLSVLYLFIFSFAGKFFYRQEIKNNPLSLPQKTIAVLVPAYKEDTIILSTAQNLLVSDYPSSLFDVYILADSFKDSTINKLKELPLHVYAVSFEKSTKTKSLNEFFKRVPRTYDIALICDADNMLEKDFLKKINQSFVSGKNAVQGKRVAKNLDTSFAILDACSEAINNHIFRKGANALGLSSAVIGSGMAFRFDEVKDILNKIDAVGGFDKILQLKLVEKGEKIQFLDNALIYDEKVDSSETFKKQRRRWVSTQFIYIRKFFIPSIKHLFKGNASYFNLALANNFVLPRAFLFGLLPLLVIAGFLFNSLWGWLSIGVLFLFFISMAMGVPKALVNKQLLQAFIKLPQAILLMFGTILHIRKANKTFIHTPHTKTEVSNTVFINKD